MKKIKRIGRPITIESGHMDWSIDLALKDFNYFKLLNKIEFEYGAHKRNLSVERFILYSCLEMMYLHPRRIIDTAATREEIFDFLMETNLISKELKKDILFNLDDLLAFIQK